MALKAIDPALYGAIELLILCCIGIGVMVGYAFACWLHDE